MVLAAGRRRPDVSESAKRYNQGALTEFCASRAYIEDSSARDIAVASEPAKAKIKPYTSAEGPPLTSAP